jgi:hypothetical protein
MAQENVFGHLMPQAQTPAPKQAPGVIYGRPKAPPAPPSAYEQGRDAEADAIRRRDQQLQEEAARRAAAEWAATHNPDGSPKLTPQQQIDKDKISVEQGKATSFALRARDSLAAYDQAGLDPDSAIGQWGNQAFPNVTARFSDDKRNAVRGAEREFIAAILRYDSGAAIPPQEFESAYLTYFPSSTAGPQEIAQKKRARETALQGLMIGAGPGADKMPPLQQRAQQPAMGGDEARQFTPEESRNFWGADYKDQNGDPLGPDGGIAVKPDGSRVLVSRISDDGSAPATDFERRRDELAKERNTFGGEIDATVRGAADAMSLGLADKISAATNTVFDGGTYADNLRNERISNAADKQVNQIARGAGQIAGAMVLPGTPGLARNAMLGGAYGGAYGFNSSDEPIAQRGDNALLGAGLGAAGATGGTLLGRGLGSAYRTATREGPAAKEVAENIDVISAGQRQGVPIRQPDARPSTRADFAAAEASPAGNPAISRTLEADKAAMQGRLQEVGGQGQVRDNFSSGELVQQAGQRYIARTRSQANALYGRAEQAAGNAAAPPTKAIDAIDRNIADLTANGARTNAGQIRYLEDLKADLASGALTIQKLRSIRTNMRGQINERSLTGTDAERRVGEVVDAASDDIAEALQGNPQALSAYKTADAFYRQKQDFIKQVAQKFLGPRDNPISAEQAASRINAMLKEGGDSGRFSRMWKELEPAEQADLRATFAEALGKGRNGEFSLAALATNMRKVNGNTAREVFGQDGLSALRDLQVIARAKADTAGALNSSRTGAVTARQNKFQDIVLGAVGGGVGGVPGALAGVTLRGATSAFSDRRAARLLLNPDFTKWLRQTPNSTSPQVINRHFERLTQAASKEPVFAADAKALQEFIAQSFTQSPGRLAAGEDERNGGPKPPQQ